MSENINYSGYLLLSGIFKHQINSRKTKFTVELHIKVEFDSKFNKIKNHLETKLLIKIF